MKRDVKNVPHEKVYPYTKKDYITPKYNNRFYTDTGSDDSSPSYSSNDSSPRNTSRRGTQQRKPFRGQQLPYQTSVPFMPGPFGPCFVQAQPFQYIPWDQQFVNTPFQFNQRRLFFFLERGRNRL